MSFETIKARYLKGYIREEQLDGTGAAPGSIYATQNYVVRGIITQAEADAIRAGGAPAETLEQGKVRRIAESKAALAEHLEAHPLEWTDGKLYSVTMDKQTLLTSALARYQLAVGLGQSPKLRWNASGERCTVWAYEDLAALALEIAVCVEPLVSQQQAIEVQINAASSREELEAIVIDYKTPEALDPTEPETSPDDMPSVP